MHPIPKSLASELSSVWLINTATSTNQMAKN